MPESKKRTARKSGKGKPRTPKEEILGGVVVSVVRGPGGGENLQIQTVEGTKLRELPILLRQAANEAEEALVGQKGS